MAGDSASASPSVSASNDIRLDRPRSRETSCEHEMTQSCSVSSRCREASCAPQSCALPVSQINGRVTRACVGGWSSIHTKASGQGCGWTTCQTISLRSSCEVADSASKPSSAASASASLASADWDDLLPP